MTSPSPCGRDRPEAAVFLRVIQNVLAYLECELAVKCKYGHVGLRLVHQDLIQADERVVKTFRLVGTPHLSGDGSDEQFVSEHPVGG